jgi:hypothetical protein
VSGVQPDRGIGVEEDHALVRCLNDKPALP